MGKLQLVVRDHGPWARLHRSRPGNSHSPQAQEQLLNPQADKETLMLCLHIVTSVFLPIRINL